MTSQEDQDLEAVYGPMANYSEHKRGEHIVYIAAEGHQASGIILWCCAPGLVGNKQLGLRYIVEPDEPMGFVDVVWPANIIGKE